MANQIHVMNAVYASPTKGINVTSNCQLIVDGGATSITVLPKDLNCDDPDFGVTKGFTITYGMGGKIYYRGGKDGDTINLG